MQATPLRSGSHSCSYTQPCIRRHSCSYSRPLRALQSGCVGSLKAVPPGATQTRLWRQAVVAKATPTSAAGAGGLHPAQLTALIKNTTSPEKLLALVQQYDTSLNPIHVSAVFVRLKQLCQQQRGLVRRPAVQQLLQGMEQRLSSDRFQAQCGAREMANVIHASACIRWNPAVRLLLAALLSKLAEATPQAVANILWAVATMGQHVREQQLQQLLTAVVNKLGEANPQDVSNTVWAVATMGQHVREQQLEQLLTALVSRLGEAKPQAVANTLWAVATMGQQVSAQQLQLEQLLAALLSKLAEAKPQDISNTVWAVATMGQTVQKQQLEQLLSALVSKVADAKPQAISNTVFAVATMGQQVPKQQLQQLLAALASKLADANPQHISNTMWAVATMGQQVPKQQLQLLLAALVSKLAEAKPQEVSNTVWAVATMGQQVQEQQLQQLLAALVSKLAEAKPQEVSNTVWACAKLNYTPTQLLEALDSQQRVLEGLLQSMVPQELANVAWACAQLNANRSQLAAMCLQRASSLLSLPGSQEAFNQQNYANLTWSAAVLDLQQHVAAVLRAVSVCSQQWGNVTAEGQCQVYQVHLWLLDCQSPAAGQGLSVCLTVQQLQECRSSWEQQLRGAAASQLQSSVFAALVRLLPTNTWQQPPAMEQRTPDGAYSVDIAAVTAAGVQLAIEVDGPSHFLQQPVNAVNGPTACRNRALAARGYQVKSIPYFEWDALKTEQQQRTYLVGKLG